MNLKAAGGKKVIKIAAAAVIGVLVLIMLFITSKSVFTTSNLYIPTEQFVQLQSGVPISREIIVPGRSPVLRSVAVTFATNSRSNEGEVLVELLDGDSVLERWNIEASELLDNAIREFYSPRGIKLNEGGTYTLRITETFEGENNIAVGQAQTGVLSCYMKTYDSASCFRWFVCMSLVFIAGFAALILLGGFLEKSVLNLAVTGVAALLILFVLEFDFFPMIKRDLSIVPAPSPTDVWDTIEPGDQKEYSFTYEGDSFETLEIFTSGENASEYAVTLINETTGVTYFDSTIVSHFWRATSDRLGMMLSTRDSVVPGRFFESGDYTLIIDNLTSDKPLNIELVGTPAEGENPSVTFAGIRKSYLGVKIASLCIILLYLYITVVSVLNYRNKLTMERFFLVTVIPLSVIYFILFQPWNIPDSGVHFLASYRVSNLMMFIRGDREWFTRFCDASYYESAHWYAVNPSLEEMAHSLFHLNDSPGDLTLVDLLPHESKMEYYSIVNWLPQGLGLTIGRLLRLNPSLSVIIARILILAAYIAGCYRAVKNTPVGKSVMTFSALLPICLMMSSSFSYDAMVFISVLNFISIVLNLRKDYTRSAFVEALAWSFILGAVKGGSGLVLLPLLLILIRKDKKSLITTGSILGMTLFSYILFSKIIPSDDLFQFGVENSGNMMASFSLEHPVEYLKMLVRTYLYFADRFVLESLGSDLAFIEPPFPMITVIGAALCMLIYATFERDELTFDKKDRFVISTIVLIAFIATPAMLLSYTPAGSGMIYGIQGRYFFPTVPLLSLCIVKFGLLRSGLKKDNAAITMNACLNTYMAITIFMVYMMLKLYLGR